MTTIKGFSLVEMAIVLALVAILMTVALPAYQDILIRSQRTTARSLLLEVASRQERFRVQHRRYGLSLEELGLAREYFVDAAANVVSAQRAIYKIELALEDEMYTGVRALPLNRQARDSDCGVFTLGRRGQRQVSGSFADTPHRCW